MNSIRTSSNLEVTGQETLPHLTPSAQPALYPVQDSIAQPPGRPPERRTSHQGSSHVQMVPCEWQKAMIRLLIVARSHSAGASPCCPKRATAQPALAASPRSWPALGGTGGVNPGAGPARPRQGTA